jgi:DNA-binding transcriptional regulator YhcF (GntR family)
MDRNLRCKIISQAELVERKTKAKGKQAGVLGQSGLRVLRSLLFDFTNAATGRCFPSYQAIRMKTGLATSTIGKALRRLEAAGFIVTTRRMARVGRRWIRRTNSYAFRLIELVTNFVSEPRKILKNQRRATFRPAGMEQLGAALASLGAKLGFAMPE